MIEKMNIFYFKKYHRGNLLENNKKNYRISVEFSKTSILKNTHLSRGPLVIIDYITNHLYLKLYIIKIINVFPLFIILNSF